MPIRFRCQDCRSRVKVPEGSQGKQVKCPRCGRIQSVPNRNHDSDHVGAQAADLTVHTLVGSMHKSPKRKEALVGPADDRFSDYDVADTGGGVPGGLDISAEDGNDYQGRRPMSRKQRRRKEARIREAQQAETRLTQEAQIAESRKSVEDLFATSHDDFSSQSDQAGKEAQQDTQITTKPVTRPEAIALDGGTLLTEEPDVVEAVYQPTTMAEQPVEEIENPSTSTSLYEQSQPATDPGFEQDPANRWTLDLTAEAYPFLKMVPWVLRVAALMLIGPAFKAMLVANDQGFSAVVSMLVLFAGLTLVAVTWTVGEIATAVRDIALRRVAG